MHSINKQSFLAFLLISIIAIVNFSVALFLKSYLDMTIGWGLNISNLTFWIPALIVISSIIFTFYHVKWRIKRTSNESIYPILNIIGIAILSFSIIYSIAITSIILSVSWIAFIFSAKSNQRLIP